MFNQLLNKINKGYVINFFSYREEGSVLSEFESVIIRENGLTYFYEDEPAKRLHGKETMKTYLKDMVENTIYNKENFKLLSFKKDTKIKVISIEFKKI